jgi:hypothetical protein
VEEIGDNDISDKINAHKNYIIAFSKIGRYEDNVLSVQEKLMSDGEFSIRDLAILTRTTYAEDGVLTASELTSQDLDKETMELGRMLGEINKCSEARLTEIRNSAGNYSVNIKNGTITFDR